MEGEGFADAGGWAGDYGPGFGAAFAEVFDLDVGNWIHMGQGRSTLVPGTRRR